ncbi:hypothetical protein WOLCODRAFT_146289 [Wolfiporia cocos MD-104 SS10]|uniref:Fungal-type protein kinase domain-containing protein n=1 Tax=Wolfiporia cocos (strain MD-104) TaxID=742152 RepID=A0A2H3J2M6_WOLCO|nr:hypothetical protein WOLCODRAFT_146289 [Wolfiporia cocos MD-104 SS10]
MSAHIKHVAIWLIAALQRSASASAPFFAWTHKQQVARLVLMNGDGYIDGLFARESWLHEATLQPVSSAAAPLTGLLSMPQNPCNLHSTGNGVNSATAARTIHPWCDSDNEAPGNFKSSDRQARVLALMLSANGCAIWRTICQEREGIQLLPIARQKDKKTGRRTRATHREHQVALSYLHGETRFRSQTPKEDFIVAWDRRPASGAATESQSGGHIQPPQQPTEPRSLFGKSMHDTWCVDSKKAITERQVYERPLKHKVAYIATPISGGDVYSGTQVQQTRTQEFNGSTTARIHHRLIVRGIHRKLEDLSEAYAMVYHTFEAVKIHDEAYTKARVIYRDVSLHNVLVDDDPPDGRVDRDGNKIPRAFLNDWDLAKFADDMNAEPMQKSRSGTWQFMSALLLQDPTKKHEISDDLESFVYIIYYLAVRFSPHPSRFNIENALRTFDEVYGDQETETRYGGASKLDWMESGKPICRIAGNPGFDNFLVALAKLCQEHYTVIQPQVDKIRKTNEEPPVVPSLFPAKIALLDSSDPSLAQGSDIRGPGAEASMVASSRAGGNASNLSTDLPLRSLKSHEDLLRVFRHALYDSNDVWSQKKTEDQGARFSSYPSSTSRSALSTSSK